MKENETKTQSKKVTKVLKTVLNTVVNILIVVVLIVSVLIAVMVLSSKTNSGMSVIFGYTIENILTDSMKGGSEDYEGGDFAAGDVIIGKYTDFDFDKEYAVGDIITYRGDIDNDTTKFENICHRIIEVAEYKGVVCYRTKGDNSELADQHEGDYAEYIRAADIGSVVYDSEYHGTIIKGLGNVLSFLQTKFGFFICVLLPMIIFFLYELMRVVFNAAYYRKAKEDENKQEAVEAAVAAALASKDADEISTPKGMTPEQMEQFRQFIEFQKQQNAAKEPAENPENNE